jgi:hypothetical protein
VLQKARQRSISSSGKFLRHLIYHIPPWLSNAYWVVSMNHHAASNAFREPPPRGKADLSSRSRFRAIVFVLNSGYRARYPHVAVATNRSAYREESRPRKAGTIDSIGISLQKMNLVYYFYSGFRSSRTSENQG